MKYVGKSLSFTAYIKPFKTDDKINVLIKKEKNYCIFWRNISSSTFNFVLGMAASMSSSSSSVSFEVSVGLDADVDA